jgi:tRNA(fMet)-specific endonuclease VapC
MRYLLDTNIVSDLVRNPQGLVMKHIREVGEEQVCTSIIVAAELRYGATKKGSPRLTAQLEAVSAPLKFCPLSHPLIPRTACSGPALNDLGVRLGATICSLQLRLSPSVVQSSLTTNGGSP